ncbi:MAG: hypothetical protein ACRDBG_20885, partial [Waterburya sp.]
KEEAEKKLEEEAALQEEALANALAQIDIEEENLILQKELWASQKQEFTAQSEAAITEIHRQALQARLDLLVGNDEKTKAQRQKTQNELIKLQIDANKKEVADRKKTTDDQNKLDAARLQAASSTVSGLTNLVEQLGDENVKATTGYKALASAEVILNGVQEVQRIWAGAATLGPIAGPILGAIQTGFAIARSAVAVGKINEVQPKRSAKYGAIIRGSAHGANYGDGGIALIDRITGSEVGEMEGNEPILTAGVTQNPVLLAAASRINVAGGGRPLFQDGGIPSNTSITVGQGAATVDNTGITAKLDALVMNIQRMTTEITAFERDKRAYVVYDDLKNAESDLDKVKTFANA